MLVPSNSRYGRKSYGNVANRNVNRRLNRNALDLMLSTGAYGNKLNSKYSLLNNLDLINNMGRVFSNKFQLTPGRNLKLSS